MPKLQARTPTETVTRTLHQRRQTLQNHSNVSPHGTNEYRIRKSRSPTPSASLKALLADSSTPIAKAHKTLKRAYAQRTKYLHQMVLPQNNIFSRLHALAPEDVAEELEPVSEEAAHVTNTAENKTTIDSIIPIERSSEVQDHIVSPATPNESSRDELAVSYPYIRSRQSHDSADSSTTRPSPPSNIMTEMSTHFAAQNEALAKRLEQVSEALAQTSSKSLEAQQLITRLATRPPSYPVQPQIQRDLVSLEHAIDRKIEEHYNSKERDHKGFWAPQKENLANSHRSTRPHEDYFNPRCMLRKNRTVLPKDKSRPILEAHEVQYRYQLEECSFQKLLGFPRVAKHEASFYASLKNSVAGECKENYPAQPTLPFHPQSGQILTWRECCGLDAIIESGVLQPVVQSVQNEWSQFQCSISAPRGSGPMDFEETGLPMDIEKTGPPTIIQTWHPNQPIIFSQPQTQAQPPLCRSWTQRRCKYGDRCKFSHATEAILSAQNPPLQNVDKSLKQPIQSQPRPCRNWAQGRGCKYGDRCKFSHAPEVTLEAQVALLVKIDRELLYLYNGIEKSLEWSWREINIEDNYQSLLRFLYDRTQAISTAVQPCSQDILQQSSFNNMSLLTLVPSLRNWWKEISGNTRMPDDLFRAIGALKAVLIQVTKMMGSADNTNHNKRDDGGHNKINYFQQQGGLKGLHQSGWPNGQQIDQQSGDSGGEQQGGSNWNGPTSRHGWIHSSIRGSELGVNNNVSQFGGRKQGHERQRDKGGPRGGGGRLRSSGHGGRLKPSYQ